MFDLRHTLAYQGKTVINQLFFILNYCRVPQGHEATETGFAYAPVSQAHGHNHIVQCYACCTAA